MPRTRVAAALLVPPPVAGEVDGLRRALGDGALGRVPPHLTLVPPVNVRDDRLGEVLALLRGAGAATRPFRVRLGPPATFLPANPVIYLQVDDPGGHVHAVRDRVFQGPLARPLTWPFVPHVTLADEASPERIEAALAVLGDYRQEVRFDRVHLLEERDGRVWEPIAEARFEARAVVGRGGLPVELAVTTAADPEAAALAAAGWDQPHPSPVVVTARRDGAVVGYAEGWVSGPSAHLSELLVAAEVRGEGIGTQLLAAFASRAAEQGAEQLTVRTEAGSRAERFYRERGWRQDARLRRYRFGRDFVQLRRDL